jgi:sigma-B regulation protein RsbU (phosphoserine phosphatase)
MRQTIEAAELQQREHRIARDLQSALLPNVPRSIPGLTIATMMVPMLQEASIGGDFCDIFPVTPGTYGILIGDVSGKGLAAAAQLATIRNMLRYALYEHRDVLAAVTQLNHIVTQKKVLEGFVTAFVGLFTSETGRLDYVSCGHEPGLLRRLGTRAVERLDTGGLPIGVSEDGFFVSNSLRLERGDAVLLYTDGVTEAGPSRSSMLGVDGLAAYFSELTLDADLNGAADRLYEGVSEFSGIGFRDDVCMVLLRRD